MTCNIHNLSVMAYGGGFTIWHYKAEDDEPSHTYFNTKDGRDMLRNGDVIYAHFKNGVYQVQVVIFREAVYIQPLQTMPLLVLTSAED